MGGGTQLDSGARLGASARRLPNADVSAVDGADFWLSHGVAYGG